MDDLQSSEEFAFVNEEVERVVQESIEYYLKDAVYEEERVEQWINWVVERCMKGLNDLKKPFKYIVTCVIMQRNGAGVHTTTSCYWDTVSDGVLTFVWPKEKSKDGNKTMYCIVTVFGLGFSVGGH
eukprot:GILK01002618.1.p1 GENE.GILK01002618.1~~GILK01002618.1.p1  ORF type:complete len:126 (+),score=13.11 GILK01002618.1:52-429(+)